MKYGDKLYVINIDELYKSTFLMETPDTHEYIVEYDKRHYKMTHLAIRRMNQERCIPYTEESIIEFYDSQIQGKQLNVKKIEDEIKESQKSKSKRLIKYDNKIKQLKAEVQNTLNNKLKCMGSGRLADCVLQYAEDILPPIRQKHKGIKRINRIKKRIEKELSQLEMMKNDNLRSIDRLKAEKVKALNIFRQDNK